MRGEYIGRSGEERRKKRSVLSQAQLLKIPVLAWNFRFPQESCSICIESYKIADEIRVLPCSHGKIIKL